MSLFDIILDIIFPKQCSICGKLGTDLCDNCYKNLKKFEIDNELKDKFFVYEYTDIIRKLLINYKFNDCSYLYRTFSSALKNNKKLYEFLKGYEVIIPVPLHRKRFLERGYNQSDLIAKEIVNSFNQKSNNKMIYAKDVLLKNKNIKPQSTKNAKKRRKDVEGIYSIKNNIVIKNKKIIIFDDIYTTGSTVNECKKTLLINGAKEVGICTLARDYIKSVN